MQTTNAQSIDLILTGDPDYFPEGALLNVRGLQANQLMSIF